MAYDVTAFDGGISFEDSSGVLTFPNNEYRPNYSIGDSDSIQVYSAEIQDGQKFLSINDVAEIASITDSRTGGAGVINIVGFTLRDLYDTIKPFFFRRVTSDLPGIEHDPFILLNGNYNADSFDQSGKVRISSANPQSISFNSVDIDRDSAVFAQQMRYETSLSPQVLMSQKGRDLALTSGYNAGGFVPAWYLSNDAAGASTGESDLSREWIGLEDGFAGIGSGPGGTAQMVTSSSTGQERFISVSDALISFHYNISGAFASKYNGLQSNDTKVAFERIESGIYQREFAIDDTSIYMNDFGGNDLFEFRGTLLAKYIQDPSTHPSYDDLSIPAAGNVPSRSAQVYTVSNYTPLRNLDASTATQTDLTNFICTLAFDLQSINAIS